jgi:hypothetical protein
MPVAVMVAMMPVMAVTMAITHLHNVRNVLRIYVDRRRRAGH